MAPVLNAQDIARITRIRKDVATVLDRHGASPTVGCTALAGVLLDVLVDLHARGDDKVQTQMRRMAERLQSLAAVPSSAVRQLAMNLADSAAKH